MPISKKSKLLLTNGKIFTGYSFGYQGYAIGEVCFNTGMTGYQEILTDPSYCDQIITMTYPHIGNYGINLEDIESKKIQANGLIVKDACHTPSNYRATNSLQNYLITNKIIGIEDVDTRSLVRCLRDEGSMNGIIASNNMDINKMKKLLKEYPSMIGKDLAKIVTCKKAYAYNNKDKNFLIVAIDYGIKENILRLLDAEGFSVVVLPAQSSVKEIMSYKPDGVFLSNGPGDPEAVTYGINAVRELLEIKIPIFGICLGHQILSLALGASTYKLKFGHRGCNHPVKYNSNEKIEITSQNHGFAVSSKNLPSDIIITHTSLNDNTIEGIKSKNYPAFSVQYHPESSPGPHDSRYLFKSFFKLIQKYKKEKTYA